MGWGLHEAWGCVLEIPHTSPHEPVLWGWVRLKVHFLIWYQSHLKLILASVCWPYQATHYWVGPLIICYPTHTRDEDISLYITRCKPQPHEPVLWGWVRLKVYFVIKHKTNCKVENQKMKRSTQRFKNQIILLATIF